MAVKACQDESATSLTPEIEECFEVIEAVIRFEPKREFTVFPMERLRFLAASDAAVKAENPGSGGFHLIFLQPDKREFPVPRFEHLRFLAASDAAVEADNPGSGGLHLIFVQSDGSQIRHICGQQLCRASDTMAACRNPHRPAGTLDGALRLSRKT